MANFFLDNKDLQYHLEHPLMRKIVELKERGFAEKDTYDYAPQNFEDAMDSYRKVLAIAGEVCGDVIAPNAESVDHEGPKVVNDHVVYAEGTQRNLDAVVKAGLSGLTLPRKYDGLNFPLLCFVMTNEMVARADAGSLGFRRSKPAALPSIGYRGFAVAPKPLRAPSRRVVVITSGTNGRAMRAPTGYGDAAVGCKRI